MSELFLVEAEDVRCIFLYLAQLSPVSPPALQNLQQEAFHLHGVRSFYHFIWNDAVTARDV